MHLDALLGGAHGERLAVHAGMLERVAAAAAAFLEEGSPDPRAHGRRLIWRLAGLAGGREGFARLIARVPSAERQRRALEALDACHSMSGLGSGLGSQPPLPACAAAVYGTGGAGTCGGLPAGSGIQPHARQFRLGDAASPPEPVEWAPQLQTVGRACSSASPGMHSSASAGSVAAEAAAAHMQHGYAPAYAAAREHGIGVGLGFPGIGYAARQQSGGLVGRAARLPRRSSASSGGSGASGCSGAAAAGVSTDAGRS